MEEEVAVVVVSVDGSDEWELDGLAALQILSNVDVPSKLKDDSISKVTSQWMLGFDQRLYLADPSLAVVVGIVPDRSSTISDRIELGLCDHTVVSDSLSGNNGSLVSHTAKNSAPEIASAMVALPSRTCKHT